MTKYGAIKAMEEGYKVTHKYFDSHEFIMYASDGSGRYETEEGYVINPAIFWNDRRSPEFNNNWEIFKND